MNFKRLVFHIVDITLVFLLIIPLGFYLMIKTILESSSYFMKKLARWAEE